MATRKTKRRPGSAKATAKMGRPRKELDWKQIGEMASIWCTQDEIANIVGVSINTLNNACKREYGITFCEFLKQKADGGRASLRRMQYLNAKKGNVTMQIWLGKQKLGQRDFREPDKTEVKTVEIHVARLQDDTQAIALDEPAAEDA